MEEKKHRITCADHPDVEAFEKCVDCGKFFCRDCIIKVDDKYHCRKCQLIMANISETIGFKEKYNLRKFRLAFGGCLVLIFVGIVAMILALIVPYLRLGTARRCNSQLKQVHKALYAYANDNDGLFPPDNNDLTPLYATKYSRGIDLFEALKCPGTKNVVTIPVHLKDDSPATVGTGMSYFYRGGLSISSDESKLVPFLWDQSPENHRGKGINVLYTNGRVKFRRDNYPELSTE